MQTIKVSNQKAEISGRHIPFVDRALPCHEKAGSSSEDWWSATYLPPSPTAPTLQ